MTLGQLLAEGTARLESAGIAEAGLDARYLLLEAFDLSAGSFLLRRMDEIRDEDARNRYEEMSERTLRENSSSVHSGEPDVHGTGILCG